MTLLSPYPTPPLALIEQELTEVLTLVEGLTQTELFRTRLTLAAARERLVHAAEAIGDLDREVIAAAPELDQPGWRGVREGLARGGADETNALWTGCAQLAPATLAWLRIHRHQRPDLFDRRPRSTVGP